MSPEMAKLNDEGGDIDLYGNDIHGLKKVINNLFDTGMNKQNRYKKKNVGSNHVYEYLKLLFYSLRIGSPMK